ncbi:DUF350 domain-containing protein [Chitinivorax sp. PXF-14]|uniref:DUF350 domain-containing protein n=1 Tax=Chitinivorax sp. PXF-14 TaxID=3230488 RepID=UPI0034671EF7
MIQLYNYLAYLLSAFALLAVFSALYSWITPIDELGLIRKGVVAATLSFSGAMLGFSLTLASSILHNDSFVLFAAWAGSAAVVQLAVYALIARVLPNLPQALNDNNVAVGGLLGGISLAVGVINAACLS